MPATGDLPRGGSEEDPTPLRGRGEWPDAEAFSPAGHAAVTWWAGWRLLFVRTSVMATDGHGRVRESGRVPTEQWLFMEQQPQHCSIPAGGMAGVRGARISDGAHHGGSRESQHGPGLPGTEHVPY
ncbi:hypothetical protein DCS_01584 [Drechmeria coniospora]|uniref:Uncharacterized protein n=1 Tax=Drechmeria coniospora TaxID=98403 RepID=A0A151GTM2_DRECN|nr:hypothetical protein DCS_01584 [Drechmeria coniospora]KYK60447.1 hypothetical protein DCS_01584 [Drechmeria coniospora]